MASTLPGSVLFACTHQRGALADGRGAAEAFCTASRSSSIPSACARRETDPFAVAVMAELGIDMTRHRGKTFDQLEDTSFDLSSRSRPRPSTAPSR